MPFQFHLGTKPETRGGKREDARRQAAAAAAAAKASAALEETETSSWTLDNVTEIVYLATQLQMTTQISDACNALENGDKNALPVRIYNYRACHIMAHSMQVHEKCVN